MTHQLTELVVSNFRSIKGEISIPLNAPIVLIHGANGAGKTSIATAIELALTGDVAALRRSDENVQDHLVHRDADMAEIELRMTGGMRAHTRMTVQGGRISGKPLLDQDGRTFFSDRCYLSQSTLGRLLDIYQAPASRDPTNTPLTNFVKNLLGLDQLEALIDGLYPAGHKARMSKLSADFDRADQLQGRLEGEQREIDALDREQTQERAELEARLAPLRDALRLPDDLESAANLLERSTGSQTIAQQDARVQGVLSLQRQWTELADRDATGELANAERQEAQAAAAANDHRAGPRGIAYGDFGVEFRLRKDSLERQLSEGATAISCLESYFGAVPDPRAPNATHRLGDLIVMMIAASLCGASNATEFALFAQERKQALSRLIDYDAAPSHDTFSRLLRLLDPEAFGRAFAAFAAAFARASRETPEVVSLDGKALRRAYEKGLAASPPLTVSAFAAETRLCLAAVSPSAGENEVEAALKVVELIDLTGRLVTADALHCHTRMAAAITQRGGDYLLALKGNRRHWLRRANLQLADATPSIAERTETSHGRNEWRQAEIVAAAEPLMPGHLAFIRITSRRDQARPLMRLFMASTLMSPQRALDLTRAHWQIENGLHWMLDVHFDEDLSRARKDNAPANTALLNRLARNILQTADAAKVPISHRIKKCAWNDDYLINAITHMR